MSATTTRPQAQRAAQWLAVVGAVGAAALCVAHAGVDVALLAALGPGGGRAVPAAAASFALGTVLFVVVAAGLHRGAGWARLMGFATFALTLVAAVTPWRGAGSAAGVVLALAGLAALALSAQRRRSVTSEKS